MKTKAIIACTLALLSLTGRALAQSTVPPVTGITAQALNGQVVVQWNPIKSVPISYYRVYYSNYSILQNDGLYDDFEVTSNDETTLTFVPPAQFNDLYIAVIAVSQGGAESEYFTEETYVKVSTGGPAEPLPDDPTLPDIPEHNTLKLLKAQALSPTEIRTEFSLSVTVDPTRAPEGLTIVKPDGSELAIREIEIREKEILIRTETQEKGIVYNIKFSEPFVGKNGQPLDPEDRTVLVSGHPDGKQSVLQAQEPPQQQEPPLPPLPVQNTETPVTDPYSPPDIANVQFTSTPQPDGHYTVTMEWTVDNASDDLYAVVVYQTRDGQMFGPPSLLPLDIRGVQLQGVTPGFFGLYVQTLNVYGYVSQGVFRYDTLSALPPASALQGNVTGIDLAADIQRAGLAQLQLDEPEVQKTPVEHVTEPLAGAAPSEHTRIDWGAATVMAGVTASLMILLIASFVMFAKRMGGSIEA